MFSSLSDRLTAVLRNVTGRGALTEKDVDAALREVRIALLEADVALPAVKAFVEEVRQKAVGQEVIRSVAPGQMVVKIVHDHLKAFLGGEATPLELKGDPAVILMAGLQGSGKTTTTGKLAKFLKESQKKKVLLASLDIYRPAAQKQLAILAEQVGAGSLPIVEGQQPEAIAKRALTTARQEGYDVVMLDTAGRLHVDEGLMAELKAVHAATNPCETLLVADAMTGQDAVRVAEAFHAAVNVTGIVLTRVDGDARGGAALSMRQVTGRPIKFFGTGEKLDGLEVFHPDRIAGRILDMGDILSLVERAAQVVDEEKARKMASKMQKGEFDFEDLAEQLDSMKKMGGLSAMMGMLPGMGQLKSKMGDMQVDDKAIARQRAIIYSMTVQERRKPDLINASRKRRIAAGAGVKVEEVNRLMKQHLQMQKMMKQLKKMGPKGMMRMMGQMKGMGGAGSMGNMGSFGGGKRGF